MRRDEAMRPLAFAIIVSIVKVLSGLISNRSDRFASFALDLQHIFARLKSSNLKYYRYTNSC